MNGFMCQNYWRGGCIAKALMATWLPRFQCIQYKVCVGFWLQTWQICQEIWFWPQIRNFRYDWSAKMLETYVIKSPPWLRIHAHLLHRIWPRCSRCQGAIVMNCFSKISSLQISFIKQETCGWIFPKNFSEENIKFVLEWKIIPLTLTTWS